MLTIKDILKTIIISLLITLFVILLIDYITMKSEVRSVNFSCEMCHETNL